MQLVIYTVIHNLDSGLNNSLNKMKCLYHCDSQLLQSSRNQTTFLSSHFYHPNDYSSTVLNLIRMQQTDRQGAERKAGKKTAIIEHYRTDVDRGRSSTDEFSMYRSFSKY
ncbi:hypothetical protein CHARACLAT_031675 [Characodon lateralis]|uniref:Uncharacterized protein n=1 Tax=Characodon lateralis TaxID=208331 RepID=A0ABU7DCC1_9TELE|nr:hypothetical protein [Characodon lateralis]